MQRCAKHGLALAPDGKCVRCRQEDDEAVARAHDEVTAPDRRRTATLGALLVTAGIAIALVAILLARPRAASTAPERDAGATSAAIAIDAGPLTDLSPSKVDASEAVDPALAANADAIARARSLIAVTLYCRHAAPACASTRQWLLDHGVTPAERDVDQDAKARGEWGAFAGGVIPAFDVEGQRFAGFDAERLSGAIDYAAAHRLQRAKSGP